MMRRAITSRWGIGGLGTLASRPEEPDPGLIEGRRAYGNGFGIAAGLTRLGMLAIRVFPRESGWPAPLDRSKDPFVGCDDSIHRAKGVPPVC
jgi:hypothetical protein